MRSLFLKEQRCYSKEELSGLLGDSGMLPKLLSLGIFSPKDGGFACSFVGLAIVNGRVLKCYPKYLPDNAEPLEELREVLKVLEKCGEAETYGEEGSGRLSSILFLLSDYFENGPYTESKEIREVNGTGEIDWDRTVNDAFTLLEDGVPYYPALVTKRRTEDSGSFFRRLHECIVTEASRELEEAGLSALFDLTPLEVSDEELSGFGEREQVLSLLDRQLGTEFNTRKQLVLKAMADYLQEEGGLSSGGSLTLYGTTSFYHVWELCASEVRGNRLSQELSLLPLPEPLKACYDPGSKLSDLIEKPLWDITGERAGDTLIPDMVTIKGSSFFIFDAKYYNPELEAGKPPKGQPGIEAVTKQYLYQLAYKDFIADHGFEEVRNCFLLPAAGPEIESKGSVRLSFLERLGLEPILVRLVPASLVFSCYLKGTRLDPREIIA